MPMRQWLYKVPLRLRSLLRRSSVEADLHNEFEFHLQMQIDANRKAGMTPEHARESALRTFGGVQLEKERCRDMRGTLWFEEAIQDIRYGARSLAKSPSFTVVALLSLALGIGANTAMFSAVNAVLLRPLPFPNPSHLISLDEEHHGENAGSNPARLADWQAQLPSLSALTGIYGETLVLTGHGDPEQVPVLRTCGRFFDVTQAAPLLGRAFLSQEENQGAPVALISESFWQRHFASDRSALGKVLRLSGKPFTIIGIMPPGETYPTGIQVWAPIPLDVMKTSRAAGFLEILGRTKGTLPIERLQPEIDTVALRLSQQYPNTDSGLTAIAVPLHQKVVHSVTTPLLILSATVFFVLLVACLNIASMLLSRASGRRREAAIRIALGASRSRLLRMFLAESLLLALAGGTLGLILTPVGLDVLRLLLPSDLPGLASASIDWQVAAFAFGGTLFCGLLAGIVPAWQASLSGPSAGLKEGGSATSGVQRLFLRRALVIGEIAVSLILLVGASLLARTFANIASQPLGFHPEHVLTATLSLPWDTPPQNIERLYGGILDRLASVPGVSAVGSIDRLPLAGGTQSPRMALRDRPLPGNAAEVSISLRAIRGDYFAAVGIPLVAGHALPPRASSNKLVSVVINQSFARRFFGTSDPIGQFITFNPTTHSNNQSTTDWLQIVGVAGDVRQQATHTVEPEAYVLARDTYWPAATIVVRSQTDPRFLIKSVREIVHDLDPDQPIDKFGAMDQRLSENSVQPKLYMWVLTGFASMALLLAALGVYGVIASDVAQRRQEIAVRMALGAQPKQVLSLMLRRGLSLTLLGLLLGIAGAWTSSRFLENLLYGVSPTDASAFALSALVLLIVSAIAVLVPSRRAASLDPIVVLRHE